MGAGVGAAAHQASLSITNSQSLLKLMSITSVMPSNHCEPEHGFTSRVQQEARPGPGSLPHPSCGWVLEEARGLLGVAFQAPPGSQTSSRGEAKDSALLSSRDKDLLEPPERLRSILRAGQTRQLLSIIEF